MVKSEDPPNLLQISLRQKFLEARAQVLAKFLFI